jgi:hypothetical protein
MGTVYRAHDPQLNRVVAVKLPQFRGSAEEQDQRIERFQREARAAASVLHPHVCPIFDVGEQDGQPYIVMAFLEGPSLAQRLAKGRFEDVGEAVKIVEQLLGALDAVHAHRIVHRDLKPGNVLFDAAGRAVLTDFGLARPEEAEPLTSEGVALGTPSYMAPEQAAGQRDRVGPWTDLYSLGVILYQMVTGRLPFEGSMLDVLNRIVYEEPLPPTQFRPELDPALQAVIMKALQKEPRDRYQTADDFAEALRPFAPGAAALQAPAVAARLVDLPSSVASVAGRPARRWTWTRALGWVLGGLLIAAAARILSYLCLGAADQDNIIDTIERCWIVALSYLVGLLGVSIWGWIESLHVPEGLLHFARKGMIVHARATIAGGVSPNVRNDLGETPLLLAAANGHGEMVKYLLLNGSNPSFPDIFGQTAISAARAKGHTDIVDVLNSTSLRPDHISHPTPWRPNARLWLVVCITIGVSWKVGMTYFSSFRAISLKQFVQLIESKQIREVGISSGYWFGELKDRFQTGRDPMWLPSKKICAIQEKGRGWQQLMEKYNGGEITLFINDESIKRDIWPGIWVIIIMLVGPMVFLGIPLWYVVRVQSIYPFLSLSSPRRSAEPGVSSPGASAAGG